MGAYKALAKNDNTRIYGPSVNSNQMRGLFFRRERSGPLLKFKTDDPCRVADQHPRYVHEAWMRRALKKAAAVLETGYPLRWSP
ncbi:hypothetical protein NXT3_PB00216 (plasmid) [Sinorhizobium fredii]|uniref:Uncharacterized protein n=1 Tax=Rhizobium fredii TaxID=380 RepID=A0A2L0HBN4_RHIFR|nr:hypothetical protein NXT3_PB00216 [Sinorhizobium fredii]